MNLAPENLLDKIDLIDSASFNNPISCCSLLFCYTSVL
jgi:hypothetical protein